MMKIMTRYPLICLLALLLIAACATGHRPMPALDVQPIDGAGYDKKVDHLVLVLDASSSMAEGYQQFEKLEIARQFLHGFNLSMPDVDVTVTLRSFGHAESVSSKASEAFYPAQAYSRAALRSALDSVHTAGGSSPLGRSLKDVAADLKGVSGPIAVIIVSDGKEMAKNTLAAAQALQAEHANQLCIYTVQVGNDIGGEVLLRRIAESADCGEAINAEALNSGKALNAFVAKVLLTAKDDRDGDGVFDDQDRCPGTPNGVDVDKTGCPLDTDGDGVVDYQDACPGTKAGEKVDARGCPIPKPVPMATKSAQVTAAGTWLYKDIQFENNSAALKESSIPTLDEIVEVLRARPDLRIEIQGHTDGSGTREYNIGLSQRRAESVKAYLESRGIDAARMTSRGYGPDRPIDSNATKQGRARNRRVEVKPVQ